MTTSAEVHEWLGLIRDGFVEYRDGLFYAEPSPFAKGGRTHKLLADLVASAWVDDSGPVLKLTIAGRRELESTR